MSKALTASVASARESIDQPTILRLKASRTAQQYSQPSRVPVLSDISDPQFIWAQAVEFAVDQIVGADYAA